MVTHHRIRYGAGNEPLLSRVFRIEACDPAGQWADVLYEEQIQITPAGTDLGWLRREFDLAAYAGQTVRIRFTEIIPESYACPAILELDDISLTYVAAPPAGAKSTSSEISPASSAELNWLYELQQANTRATKRTTPAAAAIDTLLATYW